MEVTVKSDDTKLWQHIAAVVANTKRTVEQVCMTGARAACTAFAPVGGGGTFPRQEQQGRTATGSQIRKVYATPGDIYAMLQAESAQVAAGFWKAQKAGQLIKAAAFMKNSSGPANSIAIGWDRGNAHQRLHRGNKRGRIGSRQRPLVALLQQDDVMEMQSYISEMQRRSGMTQRGFYVCLQKLEGTNRIKMEGAEKAVAAFPKWITRTQGKPHLDNGEVEVRLNDWDTTIRIKNTTPWASEILSPGGLNYIRNVAKQKMITYCRMAVSKIDQRRYALAA